MMSSLICGAFGHSDYDDYDDGDDHGISPSCFTPRRSRKRWIKRKRNPYSSLGLDKFSKLLAELEAKKKEIYLQNTLQDISLVRFVCKGSDPEPVVIKKNLNQQVSFGKNKRESNAVVKPNKIQWGRSTNALLVIGLILIFLVAFGRSGATMIMAIGWYLVPVASNKIGKKNKQVSKEIGKKTMTGSKSNKDYVRKLSENYKTVRSQSLEKKGHAHRKSL